MPSGEPPTGAPSGTRVASMRVLVIDDNVDGAEALSAVLSAMGCTPAVAFDGTQGLALAASFDPHLALIDFEMPDMSGCDVARQLRSGPALHQARLVCLTGRGRPEDRQQCLEAGFDDFFTKPVLPARLLDVLAAAGDAPRWPQAAPSSRAPAGR
jgi:CheY-like chemotaxis protein